MTKLTLEWALPSRSSSTMLIVLMSSPSPDSTAISIPAATRPRLGRRMAFWLLALTLGLLLFASSAPSPLYVVYQSDWGFSAITLTSVFAV